MPSRAHAFNSEPSRSPEPRLNGGAARAAAQAAQTGASPEPASRRALRELLAALRLRKRIERAMQGERDFALAQERWLRAVV